MININGELGTQEDLALGMYLQVTANTADQDASLNALTVEYLVNIAGPLDGITVSESGIYKVLSVVGQYVLVHPHRNGFLVTILHLRQWASLSG